VPVEPPPQPAKRSEAISPSLIDVFMQTAWSDQVKNL
jgi:hypothetical protein